VGAVGEPAGKLADVGRPLDKPLARAVRVDHIGLRIAEVWVEPREGDLAVRAGRPRTRRKRSSSDERDGKQHHETDSSAKETPLNRSPFPGTRGQGRRACRGSPWLFSGKLDTAATKGQEQRTTSSCRRSTIPRHGDSEDLRL
jgi:hypothetical protein